MPVSAKFAQGACKLEILRSEPPCQGVLKPPTAFMTATNGREHAGANVARLERHGAFAGIRRTGRAGDASSAIAKGGGWGNKGMKLRVVGW